MSLKVAVLAPINKVNFDAGEIILFIMTDQKSEMRSVGSTNDVISIGLTESELTQLASDIGLSMGVLRLSPIERGRLCNNIVRGLRSLAVHDINAAPYISLFVYLGQTNKIDAQSRQLDVHPIHLLSRQLIDQPIPELSQSTAIQCLALGAKLYINTWLHRELFDTHLAHGLQQLYSSKRPEWRQLREIDLVDAAAVKNTSDKSDSNTVNQFAKRLYSFLGTGLPDVASLRVGLRSKKTPDLSQGRGDSKQLNEPAVAKTSPDESTATVKEPDDITPDFDLFTKQIKRNLHQDLVDGNRLPIRWGRLNVLESKAAIDKLNRALFNKSSGPLSKRKRYHAATRYLSIFCGLSLKTVLRLPLAKRDGRGRGSMHVNIHGGFLRRDHQCIAPRTKKSGRSRYTGKWWRSYLPKEVVEVLIEMYEQFPQSKTIGDLIHAFGLDHELCQHFLNDGWPSSHLPEDARLAQSLRVILLNLGVHPQVVAQFTGDTMTTPSSDHYYLALPQSKLFEALDTFCSWAGLTAPTRPKQDKRIGSPNVVSKEKMGDLMVALNQRVLAARNMVTTRSDIDDVVKFHNIYAPAIALQTLWGVGGRGNLLSKNSFERLFSSEEFLIFADRRLDRYTRARIVPSTKPITDGRTNFIEHLFSLSSRLEKSKCQCASYVQQAASGKLPHKSAFFILVRTGDEWSIRDLNRQDLTSLIVELAKEVGLSLNGDDINLGRHFWYTILVEMGVAEVAIEALLGHHIPGSEPFAYGSGVSVREVCDYLAPIMETVHAAIGLNAIQGLGRTAERFKNLPTMPVPKNLRALPNLLLQTKLKAQNFEIREVPVIDADPPIDSKSLICHSYLNQLHERYLASNSLRDKPKGSLLFCLIAFDLVLSEVELKALFLDALNCGPFKVGQIVALEAQQDGRPMVQRLVSTYTTDALDLARREAFDNPHHAYEAARVELHKLIQTLASDWSPKTGDESAKHLAMIASHWAAIEVPQGTLYSVFHKAPILPVGDIARVFYGQPRIGMPTPPTPRKYSGKIDHGFKQILDIVKDFADKDHVHGNDDTRSKDCVNQLRTGQRDGTLARDFVDDALIDILCEDLSSNATYRQLKITVLPDYARKYEVFLHHARIEGSLDLDAEVWGEIYTDMGGSSDIFTSDSVRWALLHIAYFLSSRGHWAPPGLLKERAVKKSLIPRSPVYTTYTEMKRARIKIDEDYILEGGSYAFVGQRSSLQRSCPTRVVEVRFLRPRDIDLNAQVLHITSSGHNHLKSESSRGSIQMPEILCIDFKDVTDRRVSMTVGTHTLLFCDTHLDDTYEAFDAGSVAIATTVAEITGCPMFRGHDLRVAATTDIAFDLETAIKQLAKGETILDPSLKHSAESISKKHTRFALASRNARHACVLTTLRYYIVSGMVDLKCHLEPRQSRLRLSGKYEAARIGSNTQAVFAANSRHRTNQADVSLRQFDLARREYFRSIQTPSLAGPTNAMIPGRPVKSPDELSRKLVTATLMNAMGLNLDAAADALQISPLVVRDFHKRLVQLAKVARVKLDHKDDAPVLSSVLTGVELNTGKQVKSLATWVLTQTTYFQKFAARIPLAIDRSGARLIFYQASDLLHLLPLLQTLRPAGVRIYFRAGKDVQLSGHHQIYAALKNIDVFIFPKNGKENLFGVVSFAIPSIDATGASLRGSIDHQALSAKVSPRSLGRAGRLVSICLLTGLLLTT